MIFGFGRFRIDTDRIELTKDGLPMSVEPQVFGVIAHLIANNSRVVSRDELIEHVWDGRIVSDATLTSRINAARRVLDDDGKTQSVIRTFPRRGFRLIADVSEITTSSVAPEIVRSHVEKPAIAVLPLANISGDTDQDFIGDGLSEDLTTALTCVRVYRVISRTSTLKYRGSDLDANRIGAELGAAIIISGSFQKLGNRIRISVQLIDADTSDQIWADRFDRDMDDLFALQDEVVQAIVGRLEPELDLVGYARTMHAAPENLSAWELYHRAMILVAERERESTLEAQKLFRRAVEIDPNFARPHSAIAQTYAHIAVTSFELMDFDDILRSARRAVACDNRDYWSYVALGIGLQFTGDGPGSLQAFDKAIELNPYNASTRAWFGEALISTGRASEAIEQLELAIRLSPEDPWIGPFYGRLSRARFFVGDYEGAVQAATKSFQYVHAWPVRAAHCAALARLGLNDEASAALTRLVEKHPKVTRGFVRARLPIIDDAYRSDLLRALAEAGLPE